MRAVRRRTILLLLALIALALGATSAAAKTSRVTLRLPSPGHMTVAALRMTVLAGKPNALPRRVSLGVPGRAALPPSVKVLTATRSVRVRGGRRYMAAVFVVRQAAARATAHAAGAPREPDILDLIFEGGGGTWSVCRGCGAERPTSFLDDELCAECGAERFISQVAAIKDVDKRKPRRASTLTDLFTSDWTRRGDARDLFAGERPDPTLDTGHYDDGHSFGWGTPKGPSLPPPDVLRVEIDLVQDIIERQPAQLVPDLEVATAVDLNGDGTIGVKERIDTRVGPPIIT